MATLMYLGSNPKALLSELPTTLSKVEMSLETPNPSRHESVEVPVAIQAAPVRAKVRPATRVQPADANLALPSEEPTLVACSDWRPIGPAYIASGVGSGEHQVKLLCPAGANAQDTFMSDSQLHPTKMRLNDWSQIRQE